MNNSTLTSKLSEEEHRLLEALPSAIPPQNLYPSLQKATKLCWAVGLASVVIFFSVHCVLLYFIVEQGNILYYGKGLPTGWQVGHGAFFALLFIVEGIWLLPFRFLPKQPNAIQRELRDDEHPLLFSVAERLSYLTNGQKVKAFRVNLGAGACVRSDRQGATIELGASLLLFLTTSELLSVLAHEFAHTKQKGPGRVAHFFSACSARLQRSFLPLPILDFHEGTIVLHLLRMLRNLLLEPMAQLIRLLEAALNLVSREMEEEADEIAVTLLGSAPLVAGLRRAAVLDHAQTQFLESFERLRNDKYLPHDVARPPAATAALIDAKLVQAGPLQFGEEQGSIYDSHPSLKKRTQKALEKNVARQLGSEFDDVKLVGNVSELSLSLSKEAYASLEIPPGDDEKVETEHYLRRLEVTGCYAESMIRFFGGLPPAKLASVFERPAEDLQRLEAKEYSSLSEVKEELERLRSQTTEHVESLRNFGLSEEITPLVPSKGYSELLPKLDELTQVSARRLHLALSALDLDDVKSGLLAVDVQLLAELFSERSDHKDTAAFLPELEKKMGILQEQMRFFSMALNLGVYEKVDESFAEISKTMRGLEFILGDSLYIYRAPLDTSLCAYLLGPHSIRHDDEQMFMAAHRALESYSGLSTRVLGALCRVAEEVEFVLGLQPLFGEFPEERLLAMRLSSPTSIRSMTSVERNELFRKRLHAEEVEPRNVEKRNESGEWIPQGDASSSTMGNYQRPAASSGFGSWVIGVLCITLLRAVFSVESCSPPSRMQHSSPSQASPSSNTPPHNHGVQVPSSRPPSGIPVYPGGNVPGIPVYPGGNVPGMPGYRGNVPGMPRRPRIPGMPQRRRYGVPGF
ncbi:MAG: M48 family metalloprotease [Deltaproteobacteria bacterium]|nr:M48 family metalloprotease [Deltaproteobacteria bacterium]